MYSRCLGFFSLSGRARKSGRGEEKEKTVRRLFAFAKRVEVAWMPFVPGLN